ncbi:MAG TPA: hypothetical protein VFV39_05620 [Limnobacter sp.]|nr:hypothetical protein [Limnobacter sp.]
MIFSFYSHAMPLSQTRNIDLLGFGLAEIPHLLTVFKSLCELKVDDGIAFDSATIKAEEIRKEANCFGTRVTVLGLLDVQSVLCKSTLDAAKQ